MAALEDSFLRDLEDLSDDSEVEEDNRDAALPEDNEVRAPTPTTCLIERVLSPHTRLPGM